MRIQGGNNPSSTLSVDRLGRAFTISQTEPNDRLANRQGQVWSVAFTVTATINSYFFYFKNLSAQNVNITDFRSLSDTVSAVVSIRRVTGTPTPTGEVAETVTPRLLGASTELDAEIVTAASMSGLTDQGELFFEAYPTANKREKLTTTSNIIIPQGQALAFFTDTAATFRFLVSAVQEASLNASA